MFTDRFRPLWALCAAGLWVHAPVHAQTDPLWISGSQAIHFPAPGGAAVTTSALPTSFDPNLADAFEYQGATASMAQNVQADGTCDVRFFIVDGRVYNGDGLLIADRSDDPDCEVCMLPGGPHVFIAPIRGSCDRYLVMAPEIDTDREEEYTIKVRFGILDMSLVNDHPYYTTNNLTVMGRFLSNTDNAMVDDFDYWDPQLGGMSITWVNGNSQAYLADWTLPFSLTGHPDVVRIDAAALANGDQVIGLESAAALNFLLNTDRGPHYVDGTGKAQPEADWNAERSVRGELELHRSGTQLLVAYSGYVRAGGGPSIHTLGVIHSAFDLNGLPGALPLIGGQGYPRIYEVEHYTDGTGLAQEDHFGNPIEHPRVGGVEFSPNGDHIYYLKSSYHAAPHTNFGVIDRSLLPPNGVSPLAIGPYTETRKLADSELELNVDATGNAEVLYAIGTSGVGQYWLGAFTDPDVPDPANWQPNAVTLGTPATYGGINAVEYRLLNGRIRGDEHILTLQDGSCCLEAHLARVEPTLYSLTGTNTPATAWQPGQNPFQGGPTLVVFDQDVVVQPGAHLYVKDMVWRFASTARLIVRKGASITFTDCTLSSFDCPDQRWPGVRVEGQTNNPLQSGTNQGQLRLTNSTVSNAVIGVHCAQELANGAIDPAGFGGVVRAVRCQFVDNITGVRIEQYHRYGSLGNELNNICLFSNCGFLTTADYPGLGNTVPQNMALLFDVNGVRFTNCAFENQAYGSFPGPDQRGRGIMAWAASFTCTGGMNYPLHGFRNLTAGVLSADHDPDFVTTVDGMDFTNNKVGLYDLGSDDPIYTNNHVSTLDVDPLTGEATIGFFLMQSNRYTVERNSFTKPATATAPSAGIWFKGPQPEDNRIYDNSFVGLDFGCVVEGDHHTPGPITQIPIGLQMLCGYHENNFVDQFVLPLGYIRREQGNNSPSPQQSANNQFSPGADCDPGSPGPSLHAFVYAMFNYGLDVNYHYYDNANSPQMRPECIEDINGNDLSVTGFWFYDLFDHAQPVAFNAEADCDKGDLDEFQQGLQELQADYEGKLAVLHSAIASYNGTVDGGERPDLLDAIADPVAWPSHLLRDLLLTNGPLSDQVLVAAIRREVAMDPWHLTQVLIDNSPLKKDVEIVLDESEALSEFFRALLAQYEEGASARDLLEQELAIRHTDKAVAQRRLVQAVAQDSTLEGRNDTLALIFGRDTLHWGDRYLYMLHLANRDFTAAHALANGLLQVPANEGLVAYGELLEDMQGDPNSVSAPPIAELEALAFGEENSGAAQAWTRLLQLGATDSLPQGWVPEPYRSAFYPPVKHTGNMAPLLGAYPNPAQDRVMISYPEGAERGTLEVFDAQGRLMRTIALQGRKAFVEVDLSGWSEGLYLARLLFEGHRVGETKFNVVQ
ncbi:MAG: T9SS type A sorting domain-containing protein [Flavobacteriales bacterium]|nr:T9SS type A sorting domain-containing protein [Flavobacteriales bacterium]